MRQESIFMGKHRLIILRNSANRQYLESATSPTSYLRMNSTRQILYLVITIAARSQRDNEDQIQDINIEQSSMVGSRYILLDSAQSRSCIQVKCWYLWASHTFQYILSSERFCSNFSIKLFLILKLSLKLNLTLTVFTPIPKSNPKSNPNTTNKRK